MSGIDTEPVRILLVEDNPRHAQLLRDTLGDAGAAFAGAPPYDFAHVTTLVEAYARIGEGNIDLVMLDLSLPEANGLEALLKVRERFQDLPVIALVARGDGTLAAQAIQSGAQDYLMKGKISGETLARSIRHAMEVARLRAALRSLSFIDGLTGLYNRRGFVTLAEPYVKRAQRVKGHLLVVSVEVVGFDRIVKLVGFQEGDELLRGVSEIMRRSFRDSDLLGRLELAEFMALALDAPEEKFPIISGRVAEQVQEFNDRTIRRYRLILQLGFVPFNADLQPTIEDLMVQASDARRSQG
ncbi:MAG TPA: diguanylate cyclase [Gemmatimonadales bacterium]|jgi:diguanylate cyclase (GGDEF)-like protein|nr:diguanylate cyclase [Gemmatimonadales bacterium]